MKKYIRNFVPLILFVISSSNSLAQETSSETEVKEIDFVENLLETNAATFKNAPVRTSPLEKKNQKAEYTNVSSEAFHSDLAIIQRNYMPKTGRLYLNGGLSLLPSDVFYRTIGVNAKASYHFTEAWGVEAFGYFFSSQARDEVDSLKNEQSLAVKSLVSINSFYGVNIYFNSIYGKTAFGNRIIPFELYQTFGVGTVRTQNGEENPSFQVGIGDLFSLTRSSAVRVDLTWAFYNATNYLEQKQSSNSLFLTLSYGHLFPEPTYR